MMADALTREEWEKIFRQDAGAGIPEMSDRDSACLILEAMDYEQQLIAVSGLLRRIEARFRAPPVRCRTAISTTDQSWPH